MPLWLIFFNNMTVLLCNDIKLQNLKSILDNYGMEIELLADAEPIPGSFWQPPEAGLIKNTLYIRNDTPVHSALHETCHFICMDKNRRDNLDTNAGGDYEEEDAVCYLQILLSEHIPEMKQTRMFSDMDEWGYSFRLGSAKAWFKNDAEDAEEWLLKHQLIKPLQTPTFLIRQ